MLTEQYYVQALVNRIGENLEKVKDRNDLIQFVTWLEPYKGLMEQLNKIDEVEQSLTLVNNTSPLVQSTSTSTSTTPKQATELITPSSETTQSETEDIQSDSELFINTINAIEEPTESEENRTMIGKVFPFTLWASGGILEDIQYRLPEDMVRRMQLKNGYKLRIIEKLDNFPDGNPRYAFEVAEEIEVIHERLREITQAIVEARGNHLFIRKTVTSPITLLGRQVELPLRELDAERFHISEGDIINGRFYTNNLTSFRITWKYPIESEEVVTPVEKARLLQRQTQKKNNTNVGPSMLDRIDKSVLIGKKVIIVGLEGRMNDFNSVLAHPNNRKLNVVHLTGDESEAVLRREIKDSDVVLLSTKENSHDATILGHAICKDLNVPVTSTDADGLYSILISAIELLNRCEQMVN